MASLEIFNIIDQKANELKAAEKNDAEKNAEDTPLKDEDTVKPRDVKSLKESILEKLKGNKENVNDRHKNEIKITGSKDMAI